MKNNKNDLLNTALGEIILSLLSDDDIIEIMLNPDGRLWAESLTNGKFDSKQTVPESQAINIIKLIASAQHLVINQQQAELSCELPNRQGRFQAWLPPISIQATFTIRKFAKQVFPLEHYLKQQTISIKQLHQLREAILQRKNILIAGGTGSGKTTFANSLLHELKHHAERIIVLEDLPELKISSLDHVKLQTSEHINMRQLVKGSLRMRPDRIIIGEVRDGTALDMLKAWNTGHPGGICTIHANSAQAALSRLKDLAQEVVMNVPQRLVDDAIDLVVFMQRDKRRRYCVAELFSIN